MNIFISGTETVTRLSNFTEDFLDETVAGGHKIYVGDGRGTDSLVQSYLASCGYKNVVVITKEGYPRVNASGWSFIKVENVEDVIKKVHFGYMVWDGRDKKRFDIIFSFLSRRKPVRIFLTYLGRHTKIDSKMALNRALVSA